MKSPLRARWATLIVVSCLGCGGGNSPPAAGPTPAATPAASATPETSKVPAAGTIAAASAGAAPGNSPAVEKGPIDFAAVEQALKIKLPETFRKLMETKGVQLKEIVTSKPGREAEQKTAYCYFSAKAMIEDNLMARDQETDLFPEGMQGWWKTHFIVGDDGAGGYFCLSLDGSPGVWKIGSDDGPVMKKVEDSYEQYLDWDITDYRDNGR